MESNIANSDHSHELLVARVRRNYFFIVRPISMQLERSQSAKCLTVPFIS